MRPVPRTVRCAFAVLGAWIAAYEVVAIADPGNAAGGLFGKQVHLAVLAVASVLCLARAVLVREERGTWALVGGALLSWTAGEIFYTQVIWGMKSPPVPSWADAGYLAMPVLLFCGVCGVARRRLPRAAATLWADGLAAALAVGAASAAVVFDAVLNTVGGEPAAVATNLAYPLSDLLLLAVCVAVWGLNGWRLDRTWSLLAGGVVLFWIADSLYLVQTAHGTYTAGGVYDAGWWLGIVTIAGAAWQRPGDGARRQDGDAAWSIWLPVAFSVLALAVLAYGCLRPEPLNPLAVSLAVAALLTVCGRLVMTFRAHAAMLRASRDEALTDALTGLANRRALMAALDEVWEHASDARPVTLVLFDLDGFKDYNDAFGHLAGDALLVRLAHALRVVLTGRGVAYRIGGDEFCAVIQPADEVAEPVVAGAAAALSSRGEGFDVTASRGVVTLPREAGTASDALRLADQRMYANKNARRPSARRQTADVLLRVVAERHPELDAHASDVADLARATAARLGLDAETAEVVWQAAQLHDIGKLAIPDAILNKPAALDEDEWTFMRRHTVIGERILGAAPALRGVASVVRSSHERFDGTGYPDRLAGQDIPLGSRVIAVCDAYDAMVSDRPYAAAMTPAAAEAELRRCSAAQFDPVVVEAFCAVRAELEVFRQDQVGA